MKPARMLILAFFAEACLLALATPADNALSDQGKALFERRCSGCHASDINKEGPRLRGIYGRKAASVSDFTYSDSLRKLNLQWNDATLDRWLTNPDAMAPNTDMSFRLNAPEERTAVIAYLKTLSAK